MKPPKLTIELVPKSSWFKNLRSKLTKKDWDKVRKACYKNAGYRCQICGGKGRKWPVECHEVWEYEEITKPDKLYTQKLVGLIALCPTCHMVKHIGFARASGKLSLCIKQIVKVNKISERQAERLIQNAFNLYEKRSTVEWVVDIDNVIKH